MTRAKKGNPESFQNFNPHRLQHGPDGCSASPGSRVSGGTDGVAG
jgi:hypothetical protein